MYLKHFHLVEKPFEYLIPNPRYFWYTPQGEGIKAQCDYIIREKSGHLYISGPIGAGKTTLLKTLTQGLLTDHHNLINFITQNRHPMTTTPIKSICNVVIAISLRR